ncbi:RICIN domain-containing protein [Streptomyces mobaraensis]|uniref:RICIN domain-containing protein n=1 Tax=Streptomyces mobaraensis TaxID=35621 RepID=UPI00332626AD
MALVPNGVYTIARPGGRFLTLRDGSAEPGTPTLLMPRTAGPGEQEWILEELDDGTRTVRNVRSGTLLGFHGEPEPGKQVGAGARHRSWSLRPAHVGSGAGLLFHLVVPDDTDASPGFPGSPGSSGLPGFPAAELAVDVAPEPSWAGQVVLRPLGAGGPERAWEFRAVG